MAGEYFRHDLRLYDGKELFTIPDSRRHGQPDHAVCAMAGVVAHPPKLAKTHRITRGWLKGGTSKSFARPHCFVSRKNLALLPLSIVTVF
jgi:hypothetical protein